MDKAETQYASYNVLSRKALIFGVPILLLVSILCAALVTGFSALFIWGMKGMLVPVLFAFALLGVRIQCQDDSRAMDRLRWNAKSGLSRLRCQSTITSFTHLNVSPMKRKQDVKDFFKNNPTAR